MNAIFADPDVTILTCWRQAAEVARSFGREPIDVGISIPEVFFFRGGRKDDDMAAYMPRRGMPVIRSAMRAAPRLDWTPIDGMTEREVATILLQAGIFVASSEGEQFGLPALEAMASGCVVVSVPTKGGAEYLEDGWNAIVAEPSELPARLAHLIAPENATSRAMLRVRAVATACRYREVLQRRRLGELLRGPLAWLRT
jgi:glycosyltransferase involved in cell wall biosynthesis